MAQSELAAEVAALRRGEPDAFALLLARYQNRLYRYLLRMLRNPATAEDVFQQTWLRVIEKIGSYDPRRSFEAWLFSVARNLAIDNLRRYQPESLDERFDSAEPAQEAFAGHSANAFDRALERERTDMLNSALEMLPALYRETLSLRFEEEMKLEEIAEVLRVPLSTAKTRLRRGLEMLRAEVERNVPKAGIL